MRAKTLGLLGALLVLTATAARADEWGCKVLLCSSDPQGWAGILDCVPPMTAYNACHWNWFWPCWPTCPEAGSGSNEGSKSWELFLGRMPKNQHLQFSPAPHSIG